MSTADGDTGDATAGPNNYAKIVGLWRVLRPRARRRRSRCKWLVEVEGVDRKFEVTTTRLLSPRQFVRECFLQTEHCFVPMPDADWHVHVAQAVAAMPTAVRTPPHD